MMHAPTKSDRWDSGTTRLPLVSCALGALAATLVDYTIMLAAVGVAALRPPAATALGAAAGAAVGFCCGRLFIFDGRRQPAAPQALRYAAVAAVTIVGNVAGETLLVRLGCELYLARVLVAVVVGLGWSYPLQRRFVFPRRRQTT
jgi:putative flippase GtrA